MLYRVIQSYLKKKAENPLSFKFSIEFPISEDLKRRFKPGGSDVIYNDLFLHALAKVKLLINNASEEDRKKIKYVFTLGKDDLSEAQKETDIFPDFSYKYSQHIPYGNNLTYKAHFEVWDAKPNSKHVEKFFEYKEYIMTNAQKVFEERFYEMIKELGGF